MGIQMNGRRSIRARFVRSYLGAIAAVFALCVAISVYYVHESIETHSAQALRFLAAGKRSEMERPLFAAERAAARLSQRVMERLDEELLSDAEHSAELCAAFREAAFALEEPHGYAKAIFFALDPGLCPDAECVYLVDIGAFDSSGPRLADVSFPFSMHADDPSYTSWFGEAREAARPTWLKPRRNALIWREAARTLSYVVPLVRGGRFVGVVGIDVSLATIRLVLDNIDYESAFGFLVGSGGDMIYHKDFPDGLTRSDFGQFKELLDLSDSFRDGEIGTGRLFSYGWYGVRQRLALERLDNGMVLALSVPEDELFRLQSRMLMQLALIFVALLGLAVALANRFADRIIKPVTILTEVAGRIARGELNTPVQVSGADEISTLAESVRRISVELRDYITYIHAQAYTDMMTGCCNKAAYIDKIKELERRIAEQMADFTVYEFDVNGLKRTNDTFGHEAGDQLIKDAAGIIKEIFGERNVYRTGGDEFVVIDEGEAAAETARKLFAFDGRLSAFNSENRDRPTELAISKGFARFDETRDRDTKAVFARADEEMYSDKEAYYRRHEDRRRSH